MAKKNALAELEEDLRVMGLDVDGKENEILDKTRRIVAELAKVEDIKEFGVIHIREDMAIDAVENCRAIAAEGVNT